MLKLGCIADDFSDAQALASLLAAGGMRVTQTIGVPRAPLDGSADAVVVSLKTRYASPGEAIVRAMDAMVWLKTQGVQQFYFCFSPTFNSVFKGENRGNIGPVIEALMSALNTDFSVVVPAFPDQQVVVLKGHAFVGLLLLSESGLEHHPSTPMTDPNLLRVLQAQVKHKVSLIDHVAVGTSSVAIQERMVELRLSELSLALVDAATNEDLMRIAWSVRNLSLVAGSPGLGVGLPANFDFEPSPGSVRLPRPTGLKAVICGSCTETSNRQVQHFHAAGHPAMALDPLKIAKFGADKVAMAVMAWAKPLLAQGPVMLYSTATEEAVLSVTTLLGTEKAQSTVDQCLAQIATGLVELGVRQMIIGGGGTGLACLRRLGLRQMQIGAAVDPGIPWCHSTSSDEAREGIHFVVKPGARGEDDFFTRAFDHMR